jgi:hypothetical protein
MDAIMKSYFAVTFVGSLVLAQTASGIAPILPPGISATDPERPGNKMHLSAQALQAIDLSGLRLGAQKAARSAKGHVVHVVGLA